MQMIVGTPGNSDLDDKSAGGAYNGWSGDGPVHAPSTYHRLVPLCVEGTIRQAQGELPYPDIMSVDSWMEAIPEGSAVVGDGVLRITCPECIEWLKA